MKLIEIISGGYGYRNPANHRLEPKMCGERIAVTDEEAARLCSMNVAKIIGEACEGHRDAECVKAEEHSTDTVKCESVDAEGDGKALEECSMNELKKIAQEMGINTAKLKSRSALLKAISEEDSPSFNAEDSIV